MAVFGEAKEPFLRQFLTLKHGIPSHDTFSRVVPLLAPEEMLSLKDCIVTADARNCQRAIAAKVVEQGADYLLALKPISPACMNDIRRFLNDTQRTPDATHGTIDAATAASRPGPARFVPTRSGCKSCTHGPVGRHRPACPQPRNRRKNDLRNRLLPAQRASHRSAFRRRGAGSLGC